MTATSEDEKAAGAAVLFLSATMGWLFAGMATQHDGLLVSGLVAFAAAAAISLWTVNP